MNDRKFLFPTDRLHFGKHAGKEIQEVIKVDKPYFDWMLKQDFEINPILINLRKGLDIVKSEITHKFITEIDTLEITLHTFWRTHHVKGLRKPKQKTIKREVIFSYKSGLKFATETKTWTEFKDCTKFHSDYIEVKKSEIIYHYNEKELQDFINEKLKRHGLL